MGQVVADRGELDSKEAREFFGKHGVLLTLTTAYNPEANGKIERGHSPIVKALVKHVMLTLETGFISWHTRYGQIERRTVPLPVTCP